MFTAHKRDADTSLSSTRPSRRSTRIATLAVAVVAVGLLSACSTTSSASEGSAASSTLSAEQTQVLDSGYSASSINTPTTTGPAAVTGKSVWVISCGESFQGCAIMSAAFDNAAAKLGWKTNLIDSKADPTNYSAAINQAIAAKADGIALFAGDCPGIKTSLQSAQAANIPVVQFSSVDCDDPGFGSEAPLFAASLNIDGSNKLADYYQALGTARADYTAALMGGSGKVIALQETSQRSQSYITAGFTNEMAKACPNCVVVPVTFTFAQLPTAANQVWSSAMLKNPDAKALEFNLDSLMPLGLQTDIQTTGFKGQIIGGEGTNLDSIRSGAQTTATVVPYEMFSWGLADTLNRLFAGESAASLPTEGGGWQLVDKTHNLPASGPWQNPVDYQSIYEKIWSGQSK
ncbi:MAG: hypothetical protein JWQ64_1104 [Subtercola sp.]|nr:hypothetical protein [Subtercola sp.]